MTNTIFHLDSSARRDESASRRLSQHIVSHLESGLPQTRLIRRDANDCAAFINESWIEASFTPQPERNLSMTDRLRDSDAFVCELFRSDHIVIGLPLYNFGIPATLKAWVDHIARPGLSFSVDENGFEGLLKGKQAYLAVVSGSTDIEGPMDFATPYLKQVLGFLGITDVTVFSASNIVTGDGEAILQRAMETVDAAFGTTRVAV